MSFRYGSGINKPGFDALAAQTTTYTYELYSWGSNNLGQLGDGTTVNTSSPNQVGALTNWATTSGGNLYTLATKTDGTLWAWGYNAAYGQLGDGTMTNRSSPVQIGALTAWSVVSAGAGGAYVSAAIKTDGTLWTWGYGGNGVLGLGNTTGYSSPKQVGALTTWSKVSSGGYSIGAIKTDGTLWTWGGNYNGQLGLGDSGSYTNRSSPTQVGALTTWSKISMGNNTGFGITTSGALWAWGNNLDGRLGVNDLTDRSSPTQVGALTTWAGVSPGFYYTLAIKTDGTLWSWGYNVQGQLGLGNTTQYSSPKQVGALTTWLKISAVYASSSVIKTDGTLWAWGNGNDGRLGLGNTTSYSSPKQVGALTTWFTPTVGSNFGVALKY